MDGLPLNKNRRRTARRQQGARADKDSDAYSAGGDDAAAGRSIAANPYTRGTVQHREWGRGWRGWRKFVKGKKQ